MSVTLPFPSSFPWNLVRGDDDIVISHFTTT